MTYRTALFASLMVVAGSPCGAQAPASGSAAQGAASPAAPAASVSPAAPAVPATQAAAASPTAQAAPASPATPASATAAPASTAAAASSEPSPELLKQARIEGFRPKKRDGVTVFCHTDATLGTRFETEKCVNEAELRSVIEKRQDARNVLRQQNACAGCSGH